MKKKEIEKSNTLNQIFEWNARDCWQWIILAKDLGAVAEETWIRRKRKAKKSTRKVFVIGREHSRSRIAFALLGMAFENVFKGILLKRNPKLVSEGKFAKSFPATHDLESLAKEVDWPLKPEEFLLLKRISPYISWIARYPVPIKASKISMVELEDKDFKLGLKVCAKLVNQATREIMSN